MKAQFKVSVRADLVGNPLWIYRELRGGKFSTCTKAWLDADCDGWVDAKDLVAALRFIADATEKELAQ